MFPQASGLRLIHGQGLNSMVDKMCAAQLAAVSFALIVMLGSS